MSVDLRELMVYQSPPELGALYTDVEEMMVKMGKEQKVLITKQIQRQEIENKRKAAKRKQLNIQLAWGMGVLIIIFFFFFVMMLVAQSRQQMYPQYGNEFVPKTEEQRRREAQPHVYVGR